MLNRLVFLYSFSIATIIVTSVFFGFMLNHVSGIFSYIMWCAFTLFLWWVIPAPKWMIPFLKVMQTAKFKQTVTKKELQAAIKAGMAEINGNS